MELNGTLSQHLNGFWRSLGNFPQITKRPLQKLDIFWTKSHMY